MSAEKSFTRRRGEGGEEGADGDDGARQRSGVGVCVFGNSRKTDKTDEVGR